MAFKEVGSSSYQKAEPVSFTNPGQVLQGKLVEKVEISKDGKSFNKYVVEAVGGRMSFLGSYQINSALSDMPMNTVIRVTFMGKAKLKGGKTMNQFKIEAEM
jgi:hypothetical protein